MSEIHPETPPIPAAVEVPPDGARIARTGCDGGVIVIAFAPSVPPEVREERAKRAHRTGERDSARADRDRFAATLAAIRDHGDGGGMAALRKMARETLKGWPHESMPEPDGAAPRGASAEQLAIVLRAIRDVAAAALGGAPDGR